MKLQNIIPSTALPVALCLASPCWGAVPSGSVSHDALTMTGEPNPAGPGLVRTPSGTGLNGLPGTPGDLLVTDTLMGTPGGLADDDSLMMIGFSLSGFGPGLLEPVLQESDPDPSGSGGIFFSGGVLPVTDSDVNTGAAIVSAMVAGAGPMDSGIYEKFVGAPIVPIAMATMPAPGGGAADAFDDFPEVALSNSGFDMAFSAGLLGTPPAFDEALYSGKMGGGGFFRIATESMPNPTGAGVYAGPFLSVDVNMAGDVSFVSFLGGAIETLEVFDTGLGGIGPALVTGAGAGATPPMTWPGFFVDITPPGGTPPVLTDAKKVVCSVAYAGGGIFPGNDTGMCVLDYSGAGPFIDDTLGEGTVLPDGTMLGDCAGTIFTANSMGEYAFVNSRMGLPPAVDSAIIAGRPVAGGFQKPVIIALEGKPAPDASGGTNGTFSTFGRPFVSDPGVGHGLIAFHSTLLGTFGGPADDEAIFVHVPFPSTAAGMYEVIREGTPVTVHGGGAIPIVAPLDTTPELVWHKGDLYVIHDAVLASGDTAVVRSKLDFRVGEILSIATSAGPLVTVTLPTYSGSVFEIQRDTVLPFTTPSTVAGKIGDGIDLNYSEVPTGSAFFQGSSFPQF